MTLAQIESKGRAEAGKEDVPIKSVLNLGGLLVGSYFGYIFSRIYMDVLGNPQLQGIAKDAFTIAVVSFGFTALCAYGLAKSMISAKRDQD
ncbi:MAG: hypothetical protein ACP5K9_02025 [Candidatus Micrarchaeia archaeon]